MNEPNYHQACSGLCEVSHSVSEEVSEVGEHEIPEMGVPQMIDDISSNVFAQRPYSRHI
jgi:hypothetical protein